MIAFLAFIAVSLLAGVTGGLWRLGVALPDAAHAGWIGRIAPIHAALMICGVLGTVIGIERAVAIKHRAAWLAPLASGMGALCLLLGLHSAGAWLCALASSVFLLVNIAVLRRQFAAHTVLLVLGAAAWTLGCLLFAFEREGGTILPWWFAFLVMTIAAERLEMTRLMRHRPGASASLHVVLLLLLAGACGSGIAPVAGGLAYGMALTLLALWLGVFDIARRTLFAQGLSRYMAVCLLGGYAWLAIAGVAWAATALGHATRDVALHALGLGFIVSMMMGHAPVVLPAVARIKLLFGVWFYAPLAVLHLSLILRLGPGLVDLSWRAWGATANAMALAIFALTIVGSALAWRARHGDSRR